MDRKDNKILCDAHIHTSAISFCSRVPYDELVRKCVHDGLGAIVLTNHYKSAYINMDFDEWKKKYVNEFFLTESEGKKAGLKVFFGVEVTPDCSKRNDLTIYGLSCDDVLEAPPLQQMTIEELSDYVHSKNALLYHAHPFRNTEPLDGNLLDGTEINCHPLYRTCAEKKVREYADRFDLRIACGSDYHGDTYKAHCGIWIPEDIVTTDDFVSYIREVKRPELLVADDPDPDTDMGVGKGVRPRSHDNG